MIDIESIYKEYLPEIKSLIKKGLLKIVFGDNGKAYLVLTDFGQKVYNEINLN